VAQLGPKNVTAAKDIGTAGRLSLLLYIQIS